MAEDLPPGTPEIDDPLLVADLIRLLSIKGAIGRLPLADIVLPVVNLGDVVTPTINVRAPAYRSSDVFSNGVLIAPAAGAVLADTGQLVLGTFDVIAYVQCTDDVSGDQRYSFQHRNAANSTNLAVWTYLQRGAQLWIQPPIRLSYEVSDNERLRVVTDNAVGAAHRAVATIFARRRT